MSARPGVQVTVTRDADGGVSPNAYNAQISAHVRLYWPPLASEEEVIGALRDAYTQAIAEMRFHGHRPQ